MLKHFSFRVSSLSYNTWLAKHTGNSWKGLEGGILKQFIAIRFILTKIIKQMAVPSCLPKNEA